MCSSPRTRRWAATKKPPQSSRSSAAGAWRSTASALAEAFRQGGAQRILAQATGIDRTSVRPRAPPMIHFAKRHRASSSRRGRTKRCDHVERMVEAHIGGCVFLGVDPCLPAGRASALSRRCSSGSGCPAAKGFSSAYSVDIIGTGTPTAAARRTTDPCSASTSIRLPCARSISSDDRIVPGMLGDVAVHPIDHVGRNIDSFGSRHTFDLATCPPETAAGPNGPPRGGRSAISRHR